jgi:hypothetical protein
MSTPVGRAMLANAVRRDIASVLSSAQLHAWAGDTPPLLLNNAGRMVYVVLGAAAQMGVGTESPDIRILLGLGEALGDLATDGDIERHRPAIQSGLLAAERLLPKMDAMAMLASAQELEFLLSTPQGMGTSDIHRLFPTTAA